MPDVQGNGLWAPCKVLPIFNRKLSKGGADRSKEGAVNRFPGGFRKNVLSINTFFQCCTIPVGEKI